MMKHLLSYNLMIMCFFASLSMAVAQQGKVSGQILDAKTGEELIGATVQVQGASSGTVTDVSGNYQLSLDPGTYTLQISYVSYSPQTIEDVQVQAGQNTKLDFTLNEESTELEEIVVSAAAIRDNDVAMLKIQKNALAVQDGISSREISQLGSSNAAESMKQVTGASVEDGKYIVLRGLGDRYSISQLNGVTLPSADPYRNSSSLDLIPSDVVENIVTVKTYTPDQPGNFTGGKVDITTKSLPDELFMTLGVSTTYNDQSSFINNFLTDGANGKYDYFGYDDGTRSLPTNFSQYRDQLPTASVVNSMVNAAGNPANEDARNLLNNSATAFNTPFLADRVSVPLNYGAQFSVGNRLKLFDKNFGYSIGLNFDKGYTYYDNGRYGTYRYNSGELTTQQNYSLVNGDENTQVGGMINLAYQISSNHELQFNHLYNHNSNVNARIYNGFWASFNNRYFEDRVTNFQERTLNNSQLRGKHYLEDWNGVKIDWNLGYAVSSQDEPDIRLAGFGVPGPNGVGSYTLNQSEIGILPSRIYRRLKDNQYNGQVDITVPITENSDNQIKFGANYSNKSRDFREDFISQVNRLQNANNSNYLTFSEAGEDGDVSDFFGANNYGIVNTPSNNASGLYGFGNLYYDQTFPGNIYTGKEIIAAGYVQGAYNVSERLKLVGGLRVESTDFEATASNGDAGGIQSVDLLPAANAIFKLTESSNFRAAASQTLARPNLREISPFSSYSGVSVPIFTGNPDLERTLIQNYDLRYEIYPSAGEIFAVSAYYKNFDNPIVLQLTPSTSTPEIKPINVANGRVMGIEVEFRKSLGFIAPTLESLRFSINGSIIRSRADRSEAEQNAIDNANRPNLREYRPFQGQSPYIVNAALFHTSEALSWENSLSFNIFGERLAFATPALDPDVYEQPRPILNFTSRKKLGDHYSISFKAENILNPLYRELYDDPGDYVYQQYSIGRSFSVGLSYNL